MSKYTLVILSCIPLFFPFLSLSTLPDLYKSFSQGHDFWFGLDPFSLTMPSVWQLKSALEPGTSYSWRLWYPTPLNLSVASRSAVGVRIPWVPSPPVADCWQAHCYSDLQIQVSYLSLLWIHDYHECVLPRWLFIVILFSNLCPFGSSLRIRGYDANVLFRTENSSNSNL